MVTPSLVAPFCIANSSDMRIIHHPAPRTILPSVLSTANHSQRAFARFFLSFLPSTLSLRFSSFCARSIPFSFSARFRPFAPAETFLFVFSFGTSVGATCGFEAVQIKQE